MVLTLAQVGEKPPKTGVKGGYEALTALYLERVGAWHTAQTETLATEAAMLAWLERPGKAGKAGRAAVPVLLDSRGRAMSSREFARWLEGKRDQGAQHVAFAIGPADGWSEAALEFARAHGGMVLQLGAMTMAHDLARLVMAEQLYRACTILAGHPYHTGH
jgi:23S rRNA (pseudouridine1915-N3)-methyltransferase